MDFSIDCYHGQKSLAFSHEIASLRIQVFKEYPYLYDGNYEYEQDYLRRFFRSEKSILILAQVDKKIIGASTGLPLQDEENNIKDPWIKEGYNPKEIFYFGESVILEDYQGKGIGKRFFNLRESWARKNGFKTVIFCAVSRPENHKEKPRNYKSLDSFWNKLGYQKSNLSCNISWKDVTENKESEKKLRFWYKDL